MKQKLFLTVMAVLDDETQRRMNDLQQRIFSLGLVGTQTMGIPFHISLGSFPVEKEGEVLRNMYRTTEKTAAFPIRFAGLSTFSDRVLFLKPEFSESLAALHAPFDGSYADGFPWTPHATLFCGEEAEVRKAKQALENARLPVEASVQAIELGRFFPAKLIEKVHLLPGDGKTKEAAE